MQIIPDNMQIKENNKYKIVLFLVWLDDGTQHSMPTFTKLRENELANANSNSLFASSKLNSLDLALC